MKSKPKSGNQGEPRTNNTADFALGPNPWWNNAVYSSLNPTTRHGNTSDSSSLEHSADGQSLSEGRMNEEDEEAAKQSPSATDPQDHNDKRDGQSNHQIPPTLNPRTDGSFTQGPPLELIRHSIACSTHPYDPYYGGLIAPYGQPLVPHLYDMHHPRMPLPLEMAQEPVYVNAKQYHGILRRRQSRAKAELERKLIKARKPYLHESRHQHAMRRARSSGGRFAKKSDAEKCRTDSGSSKCTSSSGCELFVSGGSGTKVQEDENYRKHMINLSEPPHSSSHSG